MEISFKIYKKIEDLFVENTILWASEIANLLWISRTITHKALKYFISEKKVKKIGKWAHTRYKSLIFEWKQTKDWENPIVDYKTKKLFDEIFYKFDSSWKLLFGFEGFKTWINSRNFDFEKSVKNYIKIHKFIESQENSCWLLDATNIFSKKFEKNYMEKVFYAWEYSFMEFGRSKLAEMTFYAKQSQNKDLINKSIDEIFYKLECLIKLEKIDSIAIIPWSIERKNQLLGILNFRLQKLNLPFINLIKYFENDISIPQKTIKSKEWRINNAKNTIFINDKNIKKYKKVLLIDDFVWSWATLNITAEKMKNFWIKEIIWFSFVWSLDLNYEVINEI